MFAKFASFALLASSTIAGVLAAPLTSPNPNLAARTPQSFNNWGGISAFGNFDNFYGADNFDGSVHFTQTVVQEQQVVCHTQAIEVIQQRLLVLQEMAKRIITEQICEVETQTVVFQQFSASLSSFSGDLSRSSGHQVGYDSSIAGHFGSLCNSDGSLTSNDLGFTGTSCGSNTVVVGGSNWNDATSPASCSSALGAAQSAVSSLH
ncbi:hypothetical protein P691DRAFT_812760 [Macrolepiota fuliginosa MF-IS2]|uniref:Uncharacterized protein n=1 Tax=Macrolepiota fuliginosa MF-IS2 TaxID=1400762 RepID=A0A9P5WZZ8_9AGAR|nr:hypothetical protein P691DRAFT_812760 [Macrolepiota fuliginosa MF-IS2]